MTDAAKVKGDWISRGTPETGYPFFFLSYRPCVGATLTATGVRASLRHNQIMWFRVGLVAKPAEEMRHIGIRERGKVSDASHKGALRK